MHSKPSAARVDFGSLATALVIWFVDTVSSRTSGQLQSAAVH